MRVVQLARNLPDSGRRVSPSPIICRLVLPEAPLVQSRHFFLPCYDILVTGDRTPSQTDFMAETQSYFQHATAW